MKLKKFRVWRSIDGKLDGTCNGYEEVFAESPEEAVDTVFNWDFEDGNTHYDYVVDHISEFGGDVIESYGVVNLID